MGAMLAAEIRRGGVISFARFMDLALYCPELGYYEQKVHTPGRGGDFYTGVSVVPMLGQLLGFQFDRWAAESGPGVFQVVEAGAHDGRLALDLLEWVAQARPELAARLEYWILEPSPRRRGWQREVLGAHAGGVRWLGGWEEAPGGGFEGVIFCNELLDAFPVHRLGWDAAARRWFEWGVGITGEGRFGWERMPGAVTVDRALLPGMPEALESVFPDGFTLEVSPLAVSWWARMAGALRSGRLLALDYGLCGDEEWLAPSRAAGTLRGYAEHRLVEDVLAAPGRQDLTAQVHWGQVRAAGEAAGLATELFLAQGRFLTGLAARAWRGEAGFGAWTAERTRQFQVLTHPAHMGMRFQALVQRRAG